MTLTILNSQYYFYAYLFIHDIDYMAKIPFPLIEYKVKFFILRSVWNAIFEKHLPNINYIINYTNNNKRI